MRNLLIHYKTKNYALRENMMLFGRRGGEKFDMPMIKPWNCFIYMQITIYNVMNYSYRHGRGNTPCSVFPPDILYSAPESMKIGQYYGSIVRAPDFMSLKNGIFRVSGKKMMREHGLQAGNF